MFVLDSVDYHVMSMSLQVLVVLVADSDDFCGKVLLPLVHGVLEGLPKGVHLLPMRKVELADVDGELA